MKPINHATKMTGLFQLFFLIALMSVVNTSHALPETDAVPGGVVVLPLGQSEKPPEVLFKKRKIMVIQDQQQWFAVVGLPLSTQVGTHHITLRKPGVSSQKIAFNVSTKQYPEQHITIKNKRMVNPNQYDMKKIGQDRKRIKNALKHWQDTQDIQLDFIKPVQGPYSSAFGLRRFFNKQARKPHSGLDIAASQGTQIKAPSAGTIIEVGDYFFNGNTVFIDHGQGLISMYCHLDSSLVKKGQAIQQGEVFATVGKTGRVTGPHLHWAVSLNNTMVDPSLFMHPKDRPAKR
jgi:murein DD-endopeptidase MepM/ murein hydrolase activator NlpD